MMCSDTKGIGNRVDILGVNFFTIVNMELIFWELIITMINIDTESCSGSLKIDVLGVDIIVMVIILLRVDVLGG